ncbi:hypothetical protein B6V76_07740 [Thioclava sp. IC9]|nr:hypothetical protein B6V76_07740 [Thioclava sp. IC9]
MPLQGRSDISSPLIGMGVTVEENDIPDLIVDASRDPCAASNPIRLDAERGAQFAGRALIAGLRRKR